MPILLIFEDFGEFWKVAVVGEKDSDLTAVYNWLPGMPQ
jgi:hypothetical protein